MPPAKTYKPRRRANGRRRRALVPYSPIRRRLMFNPQPVFTETFRMAVGSDPLRPYYQMDSNAGGVLSVAISQVPQLAQYSSLYTKYRILKAVFICLPQFVTESSDVNAASYNGSQGLGSWGMSRIVTAIQDSPAQPVPVNENDVLEDNGCKIYTGRPKLVLVCRPTPDTEDANGVKLTQKGKFINFATSGPDVTHYGIRWWHTLPNPGGNIENRPYFVYCKLTFQLADPR